jgi:hypothetical protein
VHDVHGVDLGALTAPAGGEDHEPDTVLIVGQDGVGVDLERSLHDLHELAEEPEDGLPPMVLTG